MKTLISGGGIGGLATALCCLHHGHSVKVLEQASELGEIGAGLQLPPNAMKVFEALGIDNAIKAHAFAPKKIEARMGDSGRFIFTIPLARDAVRMWGSPYLHIHRADLIDTLKTSLLERAPDALDLNAKVTAYAQDQTGVKITLKNGKVISGDVLIGADGINSKIRHIMLGPDAPEFTGNVAWRAVVPIKDLGDSPPNPTACVWMGKGRHAVTYRLRGGKLANFVGIVEREDWKNESWTERGNPAEVLKDFEGWHPTLTHLIKTMKPENLYRWALFDRAPLEKWTDGRVALLGDAAHPMLPFMAQGAAMAVEDAWVVARQLSKPDVTVEIALKTYQDLRLKRTSKAQATSRANMRTFHQRTLLGQFKTYGPMWLAGRIFPRIVHTRMSWLYGHNVTTSKRE